MDDLIAKMNFLIETRYDKSSLIELSKIEDNEIVFNRYKFMAQKSHKELKDI